MAYQLGRWIGGESGDRDIEASYSWDSAALDVDTAPIAVSSGTYSVRLHTDVAGAYAWTCYTSPNWATGAFILVARLWATVSDFPTSDLGLLTQQKKGGPRYAVITPAGAIKFQDKNGVTYYESAHQITPDVLSELTLVFHGLGSEVWVNLCVGTTWEDGALTGIPWADFFDTTLPNLERELGIGENLPTGVSRNTDLIIDDATLAFSYSAADGPDQVGYPKYKIVGGAANPPNALGFYNDAEWAINGAPPPATKVACIDEVPHNQNVDYLQCSTVDKQVSFTFGGSNPLPLGINADAARLSMIQFIPGASKTGAILKYRLSGVDYTVISPQANPASGTTWVGVDNLLQSSHLARDNFTPGNLELILYLLNFGGTGLSQVSAISSPIVLYHDATLPLCPVPSGGSEASVDVPAAVPGGKGVEHRIKIDPIAAIRPEAGLLRDLNATRQALEGVSRS